MRETETQKKKNKYRFQRADGSIEFTLNVLQQEHEQQIKTKIMEPINKRQNTTEVKKKKNKQANARILSACV